MTDNSEGLFSNLSSEYSSNQNLNRDEYVDTLLKSTIPSAYLNKTQIVTINLSRKKPTQIKARSRKTVLSRKEKQKLGLLKCPKTGWNYNELSQLRQLWKEYFTSYLNLKNKIPTPLDKNWTQFSLQLNRADYHGAELSIVRSKCPNTIGLSGTCVVETKNTFVLVGRDNKCRTIPKVDSVFKIELNGVELLIYGKYLMNRPAERSSKKIKNQMIPDL